MNLRFYSLGQAKHNRHFGELNQENVINGLKSVRNALADRVSKEIQSSDKFILEGAFLDPDILKNKGRLILVITSSEEQHRKQFFHHREENEDNLNEFKAARIIQDLLINEAKVLNIEIKEND